MFHLHLHLLLLFTRFERAECVVILLIKSLIFLLLKLLNNVAHPLSVVIIHFRAVLADDVEESEPFVGVILDEAVGETLSRDVQVQDFFYL